MFLYQMHSVAVRKTKGKIKAASIGPLFPRIILNSVKCENNRNFIFKSFFGLDVSKSFLKTLICRYQTPSQRDQTTLTLLSRGVPN